MLGVQPAETANLFHGTTTKALLAIQRARAIVPRGETGRSVYKDTEVFGKNLESHPDRVYLTDTYAIQFARLAAQQLGGWPAVVRAVVPLDRLEPDTDCAHLTWRESLDRWGTCSVVGAVEIDKTYILGANRDGAPDRIETNLRHRAFGPGTRDAMHWVLMSSRQTQWCPYQQAWEPC